MRTELLRQRAVGSGGDLSRQTLKEFVHQIGNSAIFDPIYQAVVTAIEIRDGAAYSGATIGQRRRSKWKAGVRKSPLLLQFFPRKGLSIESEPLSRQRNRSSVEPIEPA